MLPENLRQFAKPIPVLNHGYVMLVDVMGDDDSVVQAARVSYAAGTKKTSNDKGLLKYLLRSRHTSPFEQARIKLEVKLPIFVERQWVRHRMASLNEMSARYSVLPNEFYIPERETVRAQSTTNKQGRGGTLPDKDVDAYLDSLRQTCSSAYAAYEQALAAGVARELARCLLPVNIYTAKVWTQDLHNLFHFLSLRMDPHAQWEIRQYAEAIAEIVKVWVPWAWEAFEDYRLNGMFLTRFEVDGLKALIAQFAGPERIFWGDGLNAVETKELREQVDLALKDPTFSLVTNFEVESKAVTQFSNEEALTTALEGSGLPTTWKGNEPREVAEFKAKIGGLLTTPTPVPTPVSVPTLSNPEGEATKPPKSTPLQTPEE